MASWYKQAVVDSAEMGPGVSWDEGQVGPKDVTELQAGTLRQACSPSTTAGVLAMKGSRGVWWTWWTEQFSAESRHLQVGTLGV